jgi:hypothetical protein
VTRNSNKPNPIVYRGHLRVNSSPFISQSKKKFKLKQPHRKTKQTTYTERMILVSFKGKETNKYFGSFQPVFAKKNCSFQF